MAKKVIKKYQEHDCIFYKLSSRKKLAKILQTSEKKIRELTKSEDLYYTFTQPKKTSGIRTIDAPREDLKRIQARISELLYRIKAPLYLFSPARGVSYIDNARHHINSNSFQLLDIEDFFPNCTKNRVAWYFHKRMLCSPDVAAILTNLTTKDGYLPQGSPCSPILAYFAYVDMWEEINAEVESFESKLSIYTDDITISGNNVVPRMVWKIKTILYRFGHSYKVEKEQNRIHRPVEVTGVIVRRGTLLLPNRQHKLLTEVKQKLAKTKAPAQRKKLLNQLIGRQSQANQIAKGNTQNQN